MQYNMRCTSLEDNWQSANLCLLLCFLLYLFFSLSPSTNSFPSYFGVKKKKKKTKKRNKQKKDTNMTRTITFSVPILLHCIYLHL